MNAPWTLIVYAVVAGFLAPVLLRRTAWPHRAPAVALAVWHGLAASFVIAVAHGAYHLVAPSGHFHIGVLGLLHPCGVEPGIAARYAARVDGLVIALPAATVLLLVGAFLFEVGRARRFRSRHLRVLDLVGRRSARLGATVLDHARPAAYCLPGRGSRVVVSEGALRLLTAEQVDAVLDHERAHIAGRHHLAMAAAQSFAAVFRWIPLARHLREQTALLLEMIADDRALRRHPWDVLAAAMYELAAGRVPEGAFAASGPSALIRLQRVLGARRRPHPAMQGAVAAIAVAMPILPFLVGCTSGMG